MHSDHFAQVFTKAFPHKTVPPMLVTHFLAKIAPTPTGALGENVRDWLAVRGIKGKPGRALNTNTWLISTVDKPVGNNSVLLSPVVPKNDRARPTVVAGQQRQDPPWVSLASLDDELQGLGDPWAKWNSTSGGSTSSGKRSDQSTVEAVRTQTQVSIQQAEINSIKEQMSVLEESLVNVRRPM